MRKPAAVAEGSITSTRLSRRQFLITTGVTAAGLAIAADRIGAIMDTDQTILQRSTFGAYAANEPWPGVQAHYDLEKAMGVRFPVMSWFQSWTNGWLAKQSADAAASGHDLQIALAPAYDNGSGVPFAEILAGKWDRRLDSYFRGAASYPGSVIIRMCHEMNLQQHPWSIANKAPCTSSIDTWLDTWRYVVDRQRAIGGSIKWQWCVNSIDMGPIKAESYWPGADYVDMLSIDVYNGYGPWTSPLKLIKPMYDRITALDPSAPVWLAEVGCREAAAGERLSKATWFKELFALTELPRLNGIIFFNSNKERDWRITTDSVRPLLSPVLRQTAQTAR